MQVDAQIALVRRFMLRVAPEVTRYSLRELELSRRPLSHLEEEESERLTETARCNAKLTLQLAMHLAASYAQFNDETEDTAPTPHPAAQSEPETPQAAVGLHCAPESLPSPFPNVPSVRQRAGNPSTSHLRSDRPDAQ